MSESERGEVFETHSDTRVQPTPTPRPSVLTGAQVEQVKDTVDSRGGTTAAFMLVEQLCDSHEALRAERDALRQERDRAKADASLAFSGVIKSADAAFDQMAARALTAEARVVRLTAALVEALDWADELAPWSILQSEKYLRLARLTARAQEEGT